MKEIILKNLKLERKINIQSFRRSISRRFALNTELMEIVVNDENITKEDLDFEHRTPSEDSGWTDEDIKEARRFGKFYRLVDEFCASCYIGDGIEKLFEDN